MNRATALQTMILAPGEKIHVIIRRLFEEDIRRHFIGEVQMVSDTAIRVKGYDFAYDTIAHQFIMRQTPRERIIATADSGNIINVIPQEVRLRELSYRFSEGRLVLTDGKKFQMEISEMGTHR